MKEIRVIEHDRNAYLKELEEVMLDPSTKRCVLRAQSRLINTLVDIVLGFKRKYEKLVDIEDITTNTIKSLTMNRERTKNVSVMKIVLVKNDKVKI